MRTLILSIFLSFFVFLKSFGQNENKVIFKIDIKKEIGSTTWLYIQKGFEEAKQENADVILIHMNTYGGEVLYADSIRTKILNSDIPVYVFVDNNAASAGALISIACDSIYIRPGGSIGAATVVNQTGEQMPDKYQSYMRATMRSTAEAHGRDTLISGTDTIVKWIRDPLIAEAMVDSRTVVPGLIDSTKTLTFTALEAQKYNYCEGLPETVEELVEKYLKFTEYEIVNYEPTSWDNLKGFLMSSVIQGLLIMIIVGGIYFELQTPGLGFPSAAALVAAFLYFAPLYMDGLAANWEILIFIIGIVLLAFELFVIPGFGIAGILGVVFIVTGLLLALLNNVVFDFEKVNTVTIARAMFTVFAGILAGFLLMLYLSSRIGAKGMLKNVALNTTLDNASGFVGVPLEQLQFVGRDAIAYTVLRPSGKVKIDNHVIDAVSNDGFIDKGESVRIERYETGQVYVSKVLRNDIKS